MQSWYESLSKQFKAYPAWAVELGIFGVLFLIIGFLAKSFGRLFFLAVLVLIGLIAAVYYFDVAPGFIAQLKDFIGLRDMVVLGDVPTIFIAWARTHIIGCIGACVGFIVGYALG